MAVWSSKKNGSHEPVSQKQNGDEMISRINKKITEENEKIEILAQINKKIAEENETIEQKYLEIGKKYVQSHSVDYEVEFAEPMEALAVSRRKINNYTLQMQYVTGVVVCSECGHKAPKGSVFCNMCGTKLPVVDFENYEVCERCGNLIAKDERVCPTCSTVRERQDPAYVLCMKCREYVEKDNRFCPNCAAPLYDNDFSNGVADSPREKVCPRCNARMGMSMRFCTECGMNLN